MLEMLSLLGRRSVSYVIHYGPGYRIYFHKRGDTIIVLLCGDKSTQAKDIKSAKRLTAEWSE